MACEKEVAIVTGGAQGLGYAFAIELLNNNYQVCIIDISETLGKDAIKTLQKTYDKSSVLFYHCDVSCKEKFTEAVESVLKTFKKVDVLINNAGTNDEVDAMKMVKVNLFGTMYGCEIAFKYMSKDKGGHGGIVINVSSVTGLFPIALSPIYSTTKHAVVGLTRSYGDAYYFEKSGIIFCALCPWFVDTPQTRGMTNLASVMEAFIENALKLCGRALNIMEPAFAAKAITKLIQDKKNGSCLVVTEAGYTYFEFTSFRDFLEKNVSKAN